MQIYWILYYQKQQTLQDLYNYQQKWYETGIEKPVDDAPDITSNTKTELQEIDREMRLAPSRSRGLNE